MTIIVDNGAYSLRNMGDVAMLQVAVSRIRRVYPAAEILVLTDRPDLLRRYCPATLPISTRSRDFVYSGDLRVGVAWRLSRSSRMRADAEPGEEFGQAFADAEILVVAGGGFINDLNLRAAQRILTMARDALVSGKRVIFLSQGLGPVNDPGLLDLLGQICNAGAYFGLREPTQGSSVLVRAGALPCSWEVTGDDALATTCDKTMPSGRNAETIGFALRQASYSRIENRHVAEIRNAVRSTREKTGATMAPLPVSFNSFEADLPAIEAVIGKQAHEWPLDDPHAVATAAGRCRIVITAAYHAAVFALAQGVPCLCLYASAYYKEKMMGLSAQFEDGCSQVDLNEASAKDICKAAIELWERSSDYRTVLRDRAAAQVKTSQAFTENALRRSEGTLRSGLRRSRTLISA